MGFGLLLCAYFLLTFMSVGIGDYCFLTYLLGAMVASRAISGLKDYNPRFRYLYLPIAAYALLAIYLLLLILGDLFLWDIPLLRGAALTTAADWLQFAAELAFAVIALWSSAEIAHSVGLTKHRDRGVRGIGFVAVWAVAQLLLWVFPSVANAGNQTPMKLFIIYQLVVYLFNSSAFYGFFSAICPQGEEFGRPSKPSRFAFINEINRKLDEKNERARLEYEKNQAAQNQPYSAKNNNRHHKKKK